MTLGELIDALRELPEDAEVYFDFPGKMYPGELNSYRGFYNCPAITYGSDEKFARKFADELEDALDQTHIGYKGGEYRYTRDDTPYVANCGWTSSVQVVGLDDEGWRGVIRTEYRP